MRADWNERAREDAHYYVAFGRREQDDDEFFATAADVIRDLEGELKRLPPDGPSRTRRALEIGCGPGRLLRPMSRHFAEIHGVDVSDEMVRQAKEKLRGIPHAHPHAIGGCDLALFPDGHFDFVYSYAVFQHIPSEEVVFSYLRETVRVLKPGGIARLQICGLPRGDKEATTWDGARISADEVRAFTRAQRVRLLSLTGVDTQYMWTTWQKPPLDSAIPAGSCVIRSVSNALSGEQAVPSEGRLACATLWIEGLPSACDLNSLRAFLDGVPGTGCYIGPAVNGLSQFNVFLPKGVRTGIVPVRLEWLGEPIAAEATVRVITPGPAVPRLTAVSDGVNLMSYQHIASGTMKVAIEEAGAIDGFAATVDGRAVERIETFRTDPLSDRWEVNFHLPAGTAPGGHVLEIHLGRRLLTRIGIEVTQ